MSSFFGCCLDPEIFEGALQKCVDPHCCCGCCSALRPRYKRLVDSIFPVNPQDGLVRSNMEKLTFYTLSSPEKLDRIGEYLLLRVGRDISRHRNGYVIVAVEALDQLLVACHAQSLNLFVESFLKMVQKLLESSDHVLQLLATQSFVKFTNIEEDTPSYHRRYDFFVSKFSSMCHCNVDEAEVRRKLRLAGLKGLQGVVRKTVGDDLQVNIWEKAHMDKIIPSLLFNMQDERPLSGSRDATDSSSTEEYNPAVLAEMCLREVAGRATFGNIKAVLQPVLNHLDNHALWVDNKFAIHTLKVIVFAIKSQYTYDVVQLLLAHLDGHGRDEVRFRTGMIEALSKIIAIAAGDAVGPSVVGTVNSLLNHLRKSIDIHSQDKEKQFQEAIINTLGEFVQNLPDYQKIEVMMFILGKVPVPNAENEGGSESDVLAQKMLLKSLLKVGTKYKAGALLATTFQASFIQPLLRISLAPDPDVRLRVQQILHTLVDRRGNLDKLIKPDTSFVNSELIVEKASRQDVVFMKKSGQDLYLCVYRNFQFSNNRRDNVDALATTVSLLAVEVLHEEVLVDIVRLTLAIQELALSNGILSERCRTSIHSVVACILSLVSHLIAISGFSEYVEQVIKRRQADAPHLLPDTSMDDDEDCVDGGNEHESGSPSPINEEFLFDSSSIVDAFKRHDRDVVRLQLPFVPRHSSELTNVSRSVSDLNSISVEVDSINSSPGITRKQPEEEITVESLKKMMAEPLSTAKEANEARRREIVETYRTATFEELVAKSEAKMDLLHNKLNEIFGKMAPSSMLLGGVVGVHGILESHPPDVPMTACKGASSASSSSSTPPTFAMPIYEVRFPELFIF